MSNYNNQPNFEADLTKFFNEFKNNFKFIGTGLSFYFSWLSVLPPFILWSQKKKKL